MFIGCITWSDEPCFRWSPNMCHNPFYRTWSYVILLTAGFNTSDHSHSGRGRCNKDVRRNILVDPSGGLLGLVVYWSLFDCMWIRHQREQDCDNRSCRILSVHALVGAEKLAVCMLPFASLIESLVRGWRNHHFRSWILILGMSGLILLFWFVGKGVALRYFVSTGFTNLSSNVLTSFFYRYSLLGWCRVCIACGMW